MRIGSERHARLAAIAEKRRTTAAEILRQAIDSLSNAPPSRMALPEARDLLDARARAGSVPAIIKVIDTLGAPVTEHESRSAREEFGLVELDAERAARRPDAVMGTSPHAEDRES